MQHVPGPQLPGPHINFGERAHPNDPNDPNDTFFIPNEPILNISTVNLTPSSDLQNSNNNGIRITRSRLCSEYTYLGPTSCYSYFSDTLQEHSHLVSSPARDIHSRGPSPQAETEKLKYQSYTNIDNDEILSELAILNIKQAFYLPSKHIANAAFQAYFDNVHPHVPIIHKDLFLSRFNDPNPNKRPPLILIQAILLIGSRSCSHAALLDANGKNIATGQVLFQRVKALCDSSLRFEYIGDLELEDEGHLFFNYPTVLVQVLSLLSWYWQGPEDLSRGPFYWLKNAIYSAITFGFHRDPTKIHLGALLSSKFKGSTTITQFKIEQQFFFWKKLWWFLFARDRGVSLSFGKPVNIRTKDGDVGVLTIDDYIKYEPGNWDVNNEKDVMEAQYYIHYIRLSEVLGLVLAENYSIIPLPESKNHPRNSKAVEQLNMIMGYLYQSLPEYLRYNIHNPKSTNMYSCLIGSVYYTILYHINRVKFSNIKKKGYNKYWGISFQSMFLSSMMAQSLSEQIEKGSVKILPSNVLYNTSLAMILLSFNTLSSNKIVSRTSKTQMEVCLSFLRRCHDYWPGITFLLVTYITERLSLGDQSGPLASRARGLLYDICRRYYYDEIGKERDSSKLFNIDFLLNTDNSNDKTSRGEGEESNPGLPDHSFDWNPGTDADDPSLPIFNIRTFVLPPVDSDFYKRFDITMLFPNSKSQSTSPYQENDENAEQQDEDAYDSFKQTDQVYNNSSALNKAETDKPTTLGPKLDKGNSAALFDSQYFLNVSSGVDWNVLNL